MSSAKPHQTSVCGNMIVFELTKETNTGLIFNCTLVVPSGSEAKVLILLLSVNMSMKCISWLISRHDFLSTAALPLSASLVIVLRTQHNLNPVSFSEILLKMYTTDIFSYRI